MSTRRRGKGEGCITKRRDGTWQFSIDVDSRDGKRCRSYIYARTRPELLRKITDERAKHGGFIRPRVHGTLGQWMDRWLDQDIKPNRSPNTYALYKNVWEKHARAVIGHIALQRLDVHHVEHLYERLRERGIGRAVLHRVAVVLSSAVQVAIRRRIYLRENPFRAIDKPRYRPKETRVLTPEEARAFVSALAQDEYAMLWLLLLSTGLRLGEALGLEWRDVDFQRATLSVRQSVTEVNGVNLVSPLKTVSSRRLVEVGRQVATALDTHKRQALERGMRSRFVFENGNGQHPSRSNLRKRHLQKICSLAGIPSVTIHGLRHTMASLGIFGGVQIKVLSERLGHSTVKLTQDRYGHVLPGMQREAADILEDILFGAIGCKIGCTKNDPTSWSGRVEPEKSDSVWFSNWWRWGDSNPRPLTCEASALPAELHPHFGQRGRLYGRGVPPVKE